LRATRTAGPHFPRPSPHAGGAVFGGVLVGWAGLRLFCRIIVPGGRRAGWCTPPRVGRFPGVSSLGANGSWVALLLSNGGGHIWGIFRGGTCVDKPARKCHRVAWFKPSKALQKTIQANVFALPEGIWGPSYFLCSFGSCPPFEVFGKKPNPTLIPPLGKFAISTPTGGRV